MKIGIVSDSHGSYQYIDSMLAHKETQNVEIWLFAGDIAMDADYLAMVTDREVIRVAGNNDWPGGRLPDYETVDIAGHTIFLTHGHLFGVNFGLQKLVQAATDVGADIAVYGHTHLAVEQLVDDVLVLNPGSIARPRDAKNGSFMVVDLQPEMAPVVKMVRI
ncbi:MAG: metallophosphoesterase [Selenomonas sp.]|uniref:metallophosphoesterase family protein n=1 Tax=Selenomonas sp. TaxID=2053611 RepID=UPI0025E023A2|nr:metallophosphoesterase [Selenomonas sp.]MCR5758181.1 metallophosphoesterase [Selenomonas sp.]